jgi:hypothetical protein
MVVQIISAHETILSMRTLICLQYELLKYMIIDTIILTLYFRLHT